MFRCESGLNCEESLILHSILKKNIEKYIFLSLQSIHSERSTAQSADVVVEETEATCRLGIAASGSQHPRETKNVQSQRGFRQTSKKSKYRKNVTKLLKRKKKCFYFLFYFIAGTNIRLREKTVAHRDSSSGDNLYRVYGWTTRDRVEQPETRLYSTRILLA